MKKYILERLAQAVITALLVSIMVFLLLHALPGGPARAIIGPRATALEIRLFNKKNGFDESIFVQYWQYVVRLLHGNLGYSYQLNQSVGSLLLQRLPKTLLLTALALLVAFLLGIPIGVLQAIRHNRLSDYVLTCLTFLLYGSPIFLLGFGLIALFGVHWHLFPAEAPQTGNVVALLRNWRGLVLPVFTLAGVTIATFTRYTRSSVIDVARKDFIRTAKEKGASQRRIFVSHVFRNAALPIVTILGLYLPALFGGALVVEYLFNYPGMGLLLWTAAQDRDYPVLLGVTLVISVATVIGSLLADLCYAVLDPRIRLANT